MTDTTIPSRFLVRGGTAANLATVNEVPKARELVFETDTRKFKLGNGATAYNSLPYVGLDSLGDPGGTRLVYWDDTTNQLEYLPLGPGLFINTDGELESSGGAPSASSVSITDSGAYFTGTDVEAALQELGNDVAALSSGSGVASGTSNPGSPSSGDLFFRTDLGFLIYYDGTRWLSMHEMVVAANNSGVGLSATGEPAGSRGAVRSDYGIYLTRWAVTTFVSTTNTGSAYWVPEVEYRNSANAATSIATISTGTTPDAANTWIQHDVAVNAVLNSAARTIRFLATKTSTPGNLLMPCTLYGRLIIT